MGQKLTIEEMQEIAKGRGGKCLSTEYINAHTKLRWQCREGHIWEATPGSVKWSRWCPKCAIQRVADSQRGNIKEMYELAKSMGGKCLSTEYISTHTKLKWQCKEGHIWEAIPSSVKRGSWCSKCAGKARLTIEEMRELAESRGGKCLSTEYINSHTKLRWQCKENHVWKATPTDVKSDKWCPKCAIQRVADSQRGNIEEMQELAESREGKCLSTEYVNTNTKLRWQCSEGHLWEATPSHVKRPQWCPTCFYKYPGVSERICRKYFEIIFGQRFPKTRPKWLVNSRGYLMELDGYSEELGLAFEYQGRQHYEREDYFHRNTNDFEIRAADDERKKELCAQNGVVLIEVPYTVVYENMLDYIVDQGKSKNVKVPKITSTISHELFDVYSPLMLKEMNELAKSRDGKCLSTGYINANTKLKWQCEEGHVWETTPGSVKSGTWCRKCAGKEKLTIEEMQEIAKSKGGNCLSTEYVSVHTKLKWQCGEGHIWKTAPINVRRGAWCPKCAGITKLTIDEMQKLAEVKGGKCLSTEYINNRTKLKWQCKRGHVWEAIPAKVKSSRWCPICAGNRIWCPICAGNRISTIEEMQRLAERKAGKCLSAEYINNRTKLKWQCKRGHVWEAIPSNVKRGKWCPTCSGNKRLTIEEMQKEAEKHRGKCLSTEYTNARTKLKWQCKKGHVFESTPDNVKRGRWCPKCSRTRRRGITETGQKDTQRDK